jgi:hypothetical protein
MLSGGDPMTGRLKARFWDETIMAAACGILFILTLVWPRWLELVFGFDPDHGSGAAEWAVTGVILALALLFGALARATRRRMLTGQ